MAGNRAYIAVCLLAAVAGSVGAVALSGLSDRPDPRVVAGIQQALDDLAAGRYAQAERLSVALATDGRTPHPRAWIIAATARQRSHRYSQADRAYRLFLASCSSRDLQDYALGQIKQCRSLSRPVQVPTAPSKRLDGAALAELAQVDKREYTESTEHFVVYARNAQLAKIVAGEAEVALDRICRVILAGQEYPHSVTIRIWPDHRAYHTHAADAPDWSGGKFTFSVNDGLVTRRIDLSQRDADGKFATIMIDRVLPHEMCHLVIQEYFGDATCPLFLNEGLAMMAEFEVDTTRLELAGNAIAGKARSSLLRMLVSRRYDLESPAVFYAEAFSFVEFLHERLSTAQFRQFLEYVKDGCTISDALQRALYMPSSETFLERLASAWEDHAVEQSQFLEALASADGPGHRPG
ncbi:MAG: hypothetical protein J7M21_06755 [Planctomycetes bacterium]|nr:hypothetical protein [Planctomycetota bacterium]